MEFDSLVSSRRSIRKFKPGISISKDEIMEIIKSAQQAPSWKNSQTARYYAVMSIEKINEVREKALPEFNSKNSENSAALLVTAFEKNRAGFNREGIPDNELENEWGAYDLGLQNQILLLKAKALGYDSLVMGIRNSDILRTMLNIPSSQEVVSVVALGKRTEDCEMPKRKPVEDIVSFF